MADACNQRQALTYLEPRYWIFASASVCLRKVRKGEATFSIFLNWDDCGKRARIQHASVHLKNVRTRRDSRHRYRSEWAPMEDCVEK